MLKIGDHVETYAGEGMLTLLPGMEEYDKRKYASARRGCVVELFINGIEIWDFQEDVVITKPQKPDWKL